MIGGNAARDWVYGSLAVEKHGPRFVHFPEDPAAGSRAIDEEFFHQLTRERLVVRRQGFTEWKKPKAAHEAGVCFVYAYAAVCGLQAMSGRYVALGKLPEIVEQSVEVPYERKLACPVQMQLPARSKSSMFTRRVTRSRFMSS